MTAYLFLATEGFPATVYDAQVVDHLRLVAEAGLPLQMVNFDPFFPRTLLSAAGRARRAALAARLPAGLSTLPFVPFEDRLGAPLARRLLAGALQGPGPVVVHARGLLAASLVAAAAPERGRVRLIFDARGDAWAEHNFHHTGQGARPAPGLERVQRLEGRVCARADRVFAVSDALAATLAGRHPGLAGRVEVFPCAYDPAKFALDPDARATWRARLGLEQRFVLLYAGSLLPYQLPEAMVALAAAAAERWPELYLLLVTPELERARGLLERAGLGPDRAGVRSAAHGEVAGLLNAADAGLLLRRRDPVNAAASPTKLAEYLACGLPVLVGPEVGDLSRRVASDGLGAVVAEPEDPAAGLTALAALRAAPPPRERLAGWAREHLARDRFVPAYLRAYRQLAGE